MRLGGRRESSNVEDRRGEDGGVGGGFSGGTGGFGRGRMPIGFPTGGGGRSGGIGIFGILIILGIMWLLGINPLELLNGGGGGGGVSSPVVIGGGSGATTSAPSGKVGAPADEGGKFVAQILGDTEDTWTRIFQQAGRTYRAPTLVLFSGSTRSACGFASAASGPFYCPNDQKLYIDLAFYDELKSKFGAPGDFAEAYVIAHEVGHHVAEPSRHSAQGRLPPGGTRARRKRTRFRCALSFKPIASPASGATPPTRRASSIPTISTKR